MKTFKIIVMTLALTLGAAHASSGIPSYAHGAPGTAAAAVEGAGLWAQLRCSACVGAAVGLAVSGWGGVLYLLSESGDVAGACVGACAGTA